MLTNVGISSSSEPKAHKVSLKDGTRTGIGVCVYASVNTLNINIPETSRLIAIKFYLKHHWSGGNTALGFGQDRIRTLVSMETDSSHRVIIEKML